MKVGIITIYRIFNFGSVLQAYALSKVIEKLGHKAELIDYVFPNDFQATTALVELPKSLEKVTLKQKAIKLLYANGLLKQHKLIKCFLSNRVKVSEKTYSHPDALISDYPNYDVYMTGSDQVWNPRYTKGDMTFLLGFVPEGKKCVSYAASFGTKHILANLQPEYSKNLSKYAYVGVREASGIELTNELCGKEATAVLDPTLLMNAEDWSKEIPQKRLVKEKYIFCYFLNYTFNAFPYADEFAEHLRKITGYKLICGARPPQELFRFNAEYKVGLGPIEFMQMIRDAEIVLTTSFHGTAFAVNFECPVYSIIESRQSGDSRQASLLDSIGLDDRVVEMNAPFPSKEQLKLDYTSASAELKILRFNSKAFLKTAIEE